MAKYTVTHSCGHEREYQLYGKHTERDRKLEWLEAQECPACRKAREIERATEGVELPALEGSPKQIAWAESIRAKFVQDIKADKYMDKDDALKTIASCTSAKVFIDERDWGVVNLLNQIKKLTPAPAQEEEPKKEAPKKEETPAPVKKSEWGKIAVNVQNVECTTAKGAKINMPHKSDFDGYSVWVSLKLLREGRHSYEYTLSIKADMEFVLKKYGNGKWNKFKTLDEKTISAEEMAEAFGGWIEDAPRMAAPAIDPDREEIIHHEPARLEPVQIEADPELTR